MIPEITIKDIKDPLNEKVSWDVEEKRFTASAKKAEVPSPIAHQNDRIILPKKVDMAPEEGLLAACTPNTLPTIGERQLPDWYPDLVTEIKSLIAGEQDSSANEAKEIRRSLADLRLSLAEVKQSLAEVQSSLRNGVEPSNATSMISHASKVLNLGRELVENQGFVKDQAPTEGRSPVENQTPIEDRASSVDQAPAEDQSFIEDHSLVEKQFPIEDQTPDEDQASAKDQASIKELESSKLSNVVSKTPKEITQSITNAQTMAHSASTATTGMTSEVNGPHAESLKASGLAGHLPISIEQELSTHVDLEVSSVASQSPLNTAQDLESSLFGSIGSLGIADHDFATSTSEMGPILHLAWDHQVKTLRALLISLKRSVGLA